jgi:hypothetical protein
LVEALGGDFFWARELSRIMAAMELNEVAAEGDFSIFRGGSLMAEFFWLTAEQRERIVQPDRNRLLNSEPLANW